MTFPLGRTEDRPVVDRLRPRAGMKGRWTPTTPVPAHCPVFRFGTNVFPYVYTWVHRPRGPRGRCNPRVRNDPSGLNANRPVPTESE